MQLDPRFVGFLEDTPAALAKFLDVLNEFHKLQGEIKEVPQSTEGPKRFRIGGTVEVTVDPISSEELDAISQGMAEAVVKEKAIQWVKGFVAGAMFIA